MPEFDKQDSDDKKIKFDNNPINKAKTWRNFANITSKIEHESYV